MKKTPLTRRTPMPRPTKQMARSPINKVSARKRKFDAAVEPMLDEYRKLFPRCQYCGRRKAREIHEMFSQGRREIARRHRSCILHLCHDCHHEVLQGAPPAFQLAVKWRADKQGFDIAEYNRLSPGTPVTMSEVDAEIQKFNPFS